MIFHKHKWSEKKSDGYQYCTKCGKAQCVHEYELIEKLKYDSKFEMMALVDTDLGTHMTYVSRCKTCGEINTVVVK